MPECNLISCACRFQPWNSRRRCRASEGYIRRQQQTLRRLRRLVPQAIVEQDALATWITLDGFRAPVVISHGFLSVRTDYRWNHTPNDQHFCRTVVRVPGRLSYGHLQWVAGLASLVRQSHEGFAAACRREKMLKDFRSVLRGVARVESLCDDGERAKISFERRMTIEQAALLASALNLWKEDGGR